MEHEELFDYIVAIIVFLAGISYGIVSLHNTLAGYDVAIDASQNKESVRYSLMYDQPILYFEPTDAFFDILSSDMSVCIKIDGSNLDPVVLGKASQGEKIAMQTLQNALNKSRYHKVTGYDPTGKISYINYIGD